MGRPSNRAERREQILDGFARAIADRGYDGATIVETARAAGLTPGLLHYHFGSKEEMLVALVQRLRLRLWRRFEARVAAAAQDRWKGLFAYLDALIGADAEADVACWTTIAGEAQRRPEVRAPYDAAVMEQLTTIESILGAVLEAEGRSTRRASEMAPLLLAAIYGVHQLAGVSAAPLPAASAARSLRRMAEALVAAEPSRSTAAARR
jgi:TetR/AcrR family transcriptional repressor of bet genes